ncbi:MAG: energy transducer TonB, partial [Pyrinomonadaceae bacterium]|nr:energy transducer TonB [Pyrinomonadaceae bacterium]
MEAPPVKTPTAAEIMRERIGKAKAFIAVRNYAAAIYELENIRRETSDGSVSAVVNVLLMNSYLEQGNYRKAREFLEQNFKAFKSRNANADVLYPAVAGQVIKGARNQIDRYRALGISVAERDLPLEAVNDIEQMRETLEMVVTQAKEITAEKQQMPVAMPLLEEATAARSSLARDDYDARRWMDEIGDAREQMANSRSVILSAVVDQSTVAQNTTVAAAAPVSGPAESKPADAKPVVTPAANTAAKPAETVLASATKPAEAKAAETAPANERPIRVIGSAAKKAEEPKPEPAAPKAETPAAAGPMEVGSLVAYAVKQQAPRYPPTAKQMRATGVVRVDIVVDEDGNVAEIQKTTGH